MDVTNELIIQVFVVMVPTVFISIVISLFNPLSIKIDIEVALPSAVGIGLLLVLGHQIRTE